MSLKAAQPFRIEVASECSLIVYFDVPLSNQLAGIIGQFCDQLMQVTTGLSVELVPSYTSVLVKYSPFLTDHFAMKQLIRESLTLSLEALNNLNSILTSGNSESPDDSEVANNIVELPVYYGEDVGPDLTRIAEHHGLSTEQVINLHVSQSYRVYAIGFAPGFGYMGEVDPKIAMPRLATPRNVVPKGAVAIADRQTAIYPAASPGGWNIIGRCPNDMFDPTKTPPMPFKVGDSVRFVAVDYDEFVRLGGEV